MNLQITAYWIQPSCRKRYDDETGRKPLMAVVDDMADKIERVLAVPENRDKTIRIRIELTDETLT